MTRHKKTIGKHTLFKRLAGHGSTAEAATTDETDETQVWDLAVLVCHGKKS